MKTFSSEFATLNYVIKKSSKILLFAHSSPDSDTVGSVLALREYVLSLGKIAEIACFDPLPSFLKSITSDNFKYPQKTDLKSFDAIIACDSVERGFDKIFNNLSQNQVVVLIDHHPDISLKGDINIIDPSYSSVCEIVYAFFRAKKIDISKNMATFLMLGILWDTGMFQHANTTPEVIGIASELMKRGAPTNKIVNLIFSNKKFETLKLWGKAFEKAKVNSKNGMIATALTKKDVEECHASTEDIAQVAAILNTVPGAKFSLILYEKDDSMIKGSLRSEDYKGVDVSKIAHKLGGGGHRLASGFEVKGKIKETENGWEIV